MTSDILQFMQLHLVCGRRMMASLPFLLLLLLLVGVIAVKGQGISVSRVGADELLQVRVNDAIWLEERQGLSNVVVHKDNQILSREEGTLISAGSYENGGADVLGFYTGHEWEWLPAETYFHTSYRLYSTNDVLVFKQSFRNTAQDIMGTGVGQLLERAIDEVSTVFPSLVPVITGKKLGFWSHGGRMAGTPCISIGQLVSSTNTIRDGNYGGPLLLFNEEGTEVIIVSSLNNFMVNSMRHRWNANPDLEQDHPGVLDFGLMGSVDSITAPGLDLETVMVYGNSFEAAFERWGKVLRHYHGKEMDEEKQDVVADYLGYWTDNGAFYYYHTMEGMNYEDTLLMAREEFEAKQIPVQYVEIDSWWYPKDDVHAVTEWTALPDVFPNGLEYLHQLTGWPIVAHNRYWSRNNVYDLHNGGSYNFIREGVSIPQDEAFWVFFFQEAKKWGLTVYNQDWQDFQISLMSSTVTNLYVGRDWLRQMNAGARASGIDIQYCMTLPKELLLSVELDHVTRVRVSEDYLLAEDQWRIGLTSHYSAALKVKPFKDVFWSSRNNPGNNFYYDCMEVDLEANPNNPWALNYRYVGPISVTASGKDCLYWADLNLHWQYPLGDLTQNGCRNPVGLGAGEGKPFCFYEADLSAPMSEWKWENCDIPVCDSDCTRDPGSVNATYPYCEEFVEVNPDLQAVVSVLSTAGVGFGDSVEMVDKSVLDKTCREDGRILTVDKPAAAAPAQILEMAFGGIHRPQNPVASDVGEIWTSSVSIDAWYFGLVFMAENQMEAAMTMSKLGLSLDGRGDYLMTSWLMETDPAVVNADTAIAFTTRGNHEFDLYYFSPIMTSSTGRMAAFLGDKRKYVPFSKSRFTDLSLTGDLLTIKSLGSVPMTLFTSDDGGSNFAPTVVSCTGGIGISEIIVTIDLNTMEESCSQS